MELSIDRREPNYFQRFEQELSRRRCEGFRDNWVQPAREGAEMGFLLGLAIAGFLVGIVATGAHGAPSTIWSESEINRLLTFKGLAGFAAFGAFAVSIYQLIKDGCMAIYDAATAHKRSYPDVKSPEGERMKARREILEMGLEAPVLAYFLEVLEHQCRSPHLEVDEIAQYMKEATAIKNRAI